MTREEAIEELSILLNKYQDGHFGDAIDMAMTALEQKTDDKCQECKKDWTKCDKCPVMIEWVNERRKGYHDALQRQAESEDKE